MGSKRWLKSSVKSVSSVREKTPQREKKLSIPFACIPTRSVKRFYIQPSQLSLKWEGGVSFNRVYNPQETRRLHVAFENMPFLPQEGRVLEWRRACSWMEKGVFCVQEGHGLERRRACVALMTGENYWQAGEEIGRKGEWKDVKTTSSTTLQQADRDLKYLLVSIDKTEIFAYLCSKRRQNGETIRMP